MCMVTARGIKSVGGGVPPPAHSKRGSLKFVLHHIYFVSFEENINVMRNLLLFIVPLPNLDPALQLDEFRTLIAATPIDYQL